MTTTLSMIGNLKMISEFGIRHFIRNEKVKCSAFTGQHAFTVVINGIKKLC